MIASTTPTNRSFLNFLSNHANLATIFSVVFVLELGERMSERFLPIYILAVGGSSVIVGLSNALDNLLGAIYSLPGGLLADRIGYKKSLIIFDVVSMAGYLIAVIYPSWPTAILGAILFTSWSSVSVPGIMTAISKNLPQNKRTMGVSIHSLIRRFPMALGPIIGGIFIEQWGEKDGVRVAFIAAFFIALVSIFFQQRFIKDNHVKSEVKPLLHPIRIFKSMSIDLKKLLLSDILIRFCEQIPYAFVVVWCLKEIKVTPVQFGVLTSIEMVTAILVYIPVAYLVEKNKTKKPYIAMTFGFFSLFPLILMFSKSFWVLAFAFFIRGMKEFGEPTRKSLILDFAQGDHQGTLYGAYYLIRDSIVSLAALVGGYLWMISPQLNLSVAVVFGVLATGYFLIFCNE